MKLYQNSIINTVYFYFQLLCSFVITNIFLVAYMIILSLASDSQISLFLLFLVTLPIGSYVITFFQIMKLKEPNDNHESTDITIGMFLKKYIKNLKSNIMWLLVMHIVLFILVVDIVFLPNPIRLVFLFMIFMVLSIVMIANYLLAKETLPFKQTFKLAIDALYSHLFKTLSQMFFYFVLLGIALWYSGTMLSLFVFFVFLTFIYKYFDKNLTPILVEE